MTRLNTRPFLVLLATVAMAAALSGCSLNYEFTECASDGDCQTFDNPGDELFYSCDTTRNKCVVNEGWECRDSGDCATEETCNANNRCEPTGDVDAGDTGDAGDTADTDQDTSVVDTGDAADTVDEPDTPTSCLDQDGEPDHTVCLAQNDNTICTPAGECVDVTSVAGCQPLHYPGTGKSDVIDSGRLVILGSILPQSPPYTDLGTTMVRAVKLAVDEYYTSGAQRLPSGEYVVHLQCDSLQSDPKVIARHMLDLGVLGIVGPLFSQNYIGVVNDVTAIDSEPDGVYEDGIVTVAPGATSPSIANLAAHGKMSFRPIANDVYQSRAMYERIMTLLENDDDTKKVAVFYKNDQYGNDFQALLAGHFLADSFAGDIKYYQYEDPAALGFDPDAITQEFGRVIGASATGGDALPEADVVVFIGTSEATSLMSAYFLTYANQGALPNPTDRRYIFSHGAASDIPSAAQTIGVAEAVPLMEAVAPDIFGLLDLTEYDNFITRYNIRYGGTVASSVAGVAYDSAAMLLLAMAAVPRNDDLTAPNVAAVLREGRLQADGAQVVKFVDPSFFTTAKQAFTLNQDVDLVGVSGELDFIFEEVGGEQVNTGEVLSRYLGLDLAQKKRVGGQQDIFYDVTVSRLYNIPPGTTDGAWIGLPATVSGQNSTDIAIPDGDATGVTASANVDSCPSSAARDYTSVIQVDVDIEHPDVSQLVVKVTHDETGTESTLHNQSGTGANLSGTFPTTLIADGSVAPFLGIAPGSGWTLSVADTNGDGQTGTLKNFAVRIFCQD